MGTIETKKRFPKHVLQEPLCVSANGCLHVHTTVNLNDLTADIA